MPTSISSMAFCVASSFRRATSSTSVLVVSVVETSAWPDDSTSFSPTGPGVSNARTLLISGPPCVHDPRIETAHAPESVAAANRRPPQIGLGEVVGEQARIERHRVLLSALGVALKSVSPAAAGRSRLERTCNRAHEPAVRGDPLALRRDLDARLQPLGESERDTRGQAVTVGGRPGGGSGSRLVVHEDELGIAAGEANLDMAGRKLGREPDRHLGEEVEQSQMQRGLERLTEPARGLRAGLVAERGGCRQVRLDRLDMSCQFHDVMMTSLKTSVKYKMMSTVMPR